MADIERSVDKLRRIARETDEEVIALLRRGFTTAGQEELSQIAFSVNMILEKNQGILYDAIQEEVERHYTAGSLEAQHEIDRQIKASQPFYLTQIDQDYIGNLVNEINLSFAEGMRGIERSTERMFSTARKIRLQALIGEGRITQKTRRTISGAIADNLRNDFTVLVDKGGRAWTLERYAEMLTRTKLVAASNNGLTNRLLREGGDLVIVSDHARECDLCHPWEGKVLSISGATKVDPYTKRAISSVQDAEAAGLMHPNCKHKYLPYRPELMELTKKPGDKPVGK